MSSDLAAPPEGYAAVGPADAPRLVKKRHVRRGWIGIGVLAIVLSALGAATLFRAIGPSQEYLAVARDVPLGGQVTSQDLQVVRLNSSPGLAPVPTSDVEQVVGAYAAVPLVSGTLLSMDQLTEEQVPAPGEQLVAIELAPGRLPGGSLSAGDPVQLVATSGGQLAEEEDVTNPDTFEGRVHSVTDTDDRSGDVVVSLLVDEQDGARVAALAADDRLTVLRVAEGDS